MRSLFTRAVGFALVWLAAGLLARADDPLHRDVLVFIPGYEASELFDPTLRPKGDDAPCVWGNLSAIRQSDFY